jgi:hypothetical protein
MRKSGIRLSAIATMVVAFMLAAIGPASAATVSVNELNLGVDWIVDNQSSAGAGAFVSGPAGQPYGGGSFQLATNSDADRIGVYTGNQIGVPLNAISSLSYCTYRDASSTVAGHLLPSIQLEVGGFANGVTYATMVFEPVYQPGASFAVGSWQCWDAFKGGNAIWWATKGIPGAPNAFNSFVPWSDIVSNNPDAVIVGRFGTKAGGGWAGTFLGNVDGLEMNGTIYDFNPRPFTKEDCKNGGWQNFTDPVFKNQGDCVSYFASNGKTHGE